MNRRLKNIVSNAAVAIFWLLLWQLAALLVGKTLLLPSPVQTLSALFALIQTGEFYLARAVFNKNYGGYIIGVIIGIIFGIAAAFSPY